MGFGAMTFPCCIVLHPPRLAGPPRCELVSVNSRYLFGSLSADLSLIMVNHLPRQSKLTDNKLLPKSINSPIGGLPSPRRNDDKGACLLVWKHEPGLKVNFSSALKSETLLSWEEDRNLPHIKYNLLLQNKNTLIITFIRNLQDFVSVLFPTFGFISGLNRL